METNIEQKIDNLLNENTEIYKYSYFSTYDFTYMCVNANIIDIKLLRYLNIEGEAIEISKRDGKLFPSTDIPELGTVFFYNFYVLKEALINQLKIINKI